MSSNHAIVFWFYFFIFLVRRQLFFVALYVQLHRLPLLSLLLEFRLKTCSESYYHNMHSGSFPAVARRRGGGLRCSSGCCLLCDWRVRRPRVCLRACVGGQWTVYACAPVPSALFGCTYYAYYIYYFRFIYDVFYIFYNYSDYSYYRYRYIS